MDPRRFACLLFLSTLPLAAQGLPGLIPGQAQPAPTPQTPEEQLAGLQREKERLLREIDYVKNRVANAKDLLAGKFATRDLSVRAIDAGRSTTAPAPAAPMTPRHARLMQDDERGNYPADTLLVVNGVPISREAYNLLLAHENPNIDASMRGQMGLYDLIRTEGTAAAFGEDSRLEQLSNVAADLAAGKTVAELAPKYATLPGASAEGRLEITHNSQFGPRFEQVAFDLEVGQTSRAFRHHTGFIVLHKDSVEKGATPELDKAVVHCLLIPYSESPEELQKVQGMIASGQVEIVVTDKETMMLLPAVFRAPEYLPKPATAPADRIGTMQKSLDTLAAEIERVRSADGEVERARLPLLEARYERLKNELLKIGDEQHPGTDEVVMPPPQKPQKGGKGEPDQKDPKDQ
jgi:hypothetical protein